MDGNLHKKNTSEPPQSTKPTVWAEKLQDPGDKFQLIIVVLEVVNHGEPSQSTKPAVWEEKLPDPGDKFQLTIVVLEE